MKSPTEWLASQNKFDSNNSTEDKIAPEKLASVISVTGGKGGVGKTSVALKVSKILAEDKKVLLIDCDYNLSNTVLKLGLPVNDNFYSLLVGKKPFEECVYKIGNLDLLPACNGNFELHDEKFEIERFIIDIVSTYQKNYDYIILDCPAGITKKALSLNAYSDYRLVVVTPDKSSITDSYSLIKLLNTKYGVNDYHLVLNKISTLKQFDRIVTTMCETAYNFLNCRLSILGKILLEDVSVDQFDRILLREEKNALHKSFLKVVKKLTEEIGNTSRLQLAGRSSFGEGDNGQDVQPI